MNDSDFRDELGRFLKDRRARLRPADVGLPATTRRRVRGLRREEVASLANIGVSWYTALENGTASGVSSSTLNDIAGALHLSDSERHYVNALVGNATRRKEREEPATLEIRALMAINHPAYIITATWLIIACNDAFRLVWGVEDELPIDALTRLYIDARARAMHGDHFSSNIKPIVAMIRSGIGRHPHLERLRVLRDLLVADEEIAPIWHQFEVESPLATVSAKITSPIGRYEYETLTLAIGDGFYGIVIEVPTVETAARLAMAMASAE